MEVILGYTVIDLGTLIGAKCVESFNPLLDRTDSLSDGISLMTHEYYSMGERDRRHVVTHYDVVPTGAVVATTTPSVETEGGEVWAESSPGTNLSAAFAELKDVAARSFGAYSNIVDERNFSAYGLASFGELAKQAMEAPMVVYYVSASALSRYQVTRHPRELLRDFDKGFCPVRVGDRVHSGMTFIRRSRGWEPVAYGSGALARRIANARSEVLASNRGLKTEDVFVVQVPQVSFNTHFVGYETAEGLMLRPTYEDKIPDLTLSREKSLPANRVFEALSSLVRRLDQLRFPVVP